MWLQCYNCYQIVALFSQYIKKVIHAKWMQIIYTNFKVVTLLVALDFSALSWW